MWIYEFSNLLKVNLRESAVCCFSVEGSLPTPLPYPPLHGPVLWRTMIERAQTNVEIGKKYTVIVGSTQGDILVKKSISKEIPLAFLISLPPSNPIKLEVKRETLSVQGWLRIGAQRFIPLSRSLSLLMTNTMIFLFPLKNSPPKGAIDFLFSVPWCVQATRCNYLPRSGYFFILSWTPRVHLFSEWVIWEVLWLITQGIYSVFVTSYNAFLEKGNN